MLKGLAGWGGNFFQEWRSMEFLRRDQNFFFLFTTKSVGLRRHRWPQYFSPGYYYMESLNFSLLKHCTFVYQSFEISSTIWQKFYFIFSQRSQWGCGVIDGLSITSQGNTMWNHWTLVYPSTELSSTNILNFCLLQDIELSVRWVCSVTDNLSY